MNPSTSRCRVAAVICVFALWGGLTWYFSHWLVGQDTIYLALTDAGFGYICSTAETVNFLGLIPSVLVSFAVGVAASAFVVDDVSKPPG